MKRIITDTNVWYNITQEEIIEISETHKLVIPIIVLGELYTSPNIHKSQESNNSLKRAVKIILDNVQFIEFIKLDPFEYLLKDIKPSIIPRLSVTWYFNEFEALLNLDYETVKTTHPERADISSLTNYFNEKSIEMKKIIDADKGRFKRHNTNQNTQILILKFANDGLKKIDNSNPEITSLDNDKYELLINVFDDTLREISKSGKKIKDNDWIDIFNMTYVGKEDLYWTAEKSKKRSIENVGLQHYLYSCC